MSFEIKALINTKFASSSLNGEYTVPAGKTAIIDKFTATNTDGSTRTIVVHIVPSGQSYSGSTIIIDSRSITTLSTDDLTELQNQVLEAGDKIVVSADAASQVVIRCSGRVVS